MAPYLFALLIAYAFLKLLAEAASAPLSGDEIFTLTLARLPHVSTLWKALLHGADGQPPLFYLIERLSQHLVPNTHVALRLPAVVGFCCTLACVYVFVRGRTGRFAALLCALILLNTSLYLTYAVEARPYGLVVGAISFAMVCYQRVRNLVWVVLLFLSLAFAVSLHYYAVFALGAFVAAEAAFYWHSHKLRIGVWLAIVLCAAPLLAFWPLLRAQKEIYGRNFWAHPKLSGALATYGSFFHLPVFVAIGAVAVLVWFLAKPEEWRSVASKGAAPFEERTLILALMAMPFVVFLAARIGGGAFLERYILWVTVAVVSGVGWLLSRTGETGFAAFVAFILIATLGQEGYSLYSLRSRLGRIRSPAASVENLVKMAGHPDLPVVVWADAAAIEHYAAPETARRLVTLTDPSAAMEFLGTDTGDKLASAISEYGSLTVRDFHAFVAAHPEFLLYSSPLNSAQGTTVFYDWWVPRLAKDGYTLQLLAAAGNDRMYLVRSPTPQ
jgi:hypothetical protein